MFLGDLYALSGLFIPEDEWKVKEAWCVVRGDLGSWLLLEVRFFWNLLVKIDREKTAHVE